MLFDDKTHTSFQDGILNHRSLDVRQQSAPDLMPSDLPYTWGRLCLGNGSASGPGEAPSIFLTGQGVATGASIGLEFLLQCL